MNSLAYIIYLPVTLYITIVVGKSFFRNGSVFLYHLFQDPKKGNEINKLLLAGYYLLNGGYAFLSIYGWPSIVTYHELIATTSSRISIIVMGLAIMHYFNMYLLYQLAHKAHSKNHLS